VTTDLNAWREQRAALRRFVGRRVADRHEAEDVVQDTLLRAWEARERLRSPERMPAWLGRIAAHRIVDLHRSRRPQVELPEELAAAEHEDDPVAELAPCLERFVDQLPAPYRDALRWSELEGAPLHEVARRQGVSLSGAKSRVQRGRARLRSVVEACCRVLREGRVIAGFEPVRRCRGSCTS
jgi:RNA polymerase sigma-70 factor (ECF subfamily)